MKCEEAQKLVTALVDNELPAAERAAVQEHLKICSDCALLHRREAALKSEIRAAAANLKAPAALREKIINDPRVFPRRGFDQPAWRNLIFRPAFALALLALISLPAVYLMRPVDKPVSLSALEIHRAILNKQVAVIQAASPEAIKDDLVRSVAGSFSPMVYDLSRMSLRAVAGTVREVNGRKLLVTVYEGAGLTVTCYTFLGAETDAPAAAERFYDALKKINFYTYSRGGINAVLHREGNLICILVSTLPMAELLTIAGYTA
jgi:anti-sigma factor RsiW